MNNNDFVAEILRATGTLQSGDPAGVTAIIQNALAAAGLTGAPGAVPRALRTPPGVEAPSLPPRAERLRKPLSEVVRTLRAGKGVALEGLSFELPNFNGLPGMGQTAPTPQLPLPEGAKFLDLRFDCAAGARRYRLYVPATAGEGLQGMVVMLHGCTQNPEDFAAGTGMNALAEARRLLVVYPAQTGGDNSMSCWNWFRPGDQVRDAGEPAILAGLAQSLRDEYAVPADRVFVAGLSAGGAMAAILGETYPELFSAIGVHSGLPYAAANDVLSAFTAMRGPTGITRPASPDGAGSKDAPRVIVFHGSADTTVHPSNAGRIVADQEGRHGRTSRSEQTASSETRGYTRLIAEGEDGAHAIECWMIEGAAHAWAGGSAAGTYTDPRGPDASAAMVRFFLDGTSDPA